MSPVVAAVTVAVSTDPFVASSPAPAKAAGATMRTVAESAASAAASSLNCISVFRTITLALPSGPLCLRVDGCARVWAAGLYRVINAVTVRLRARSCRNLNSYHEGI